ncbi:TauD/TfdA family dioxygenase, partial [Aquidulcibacter sp.]|uniref:TauD/TfdA dioxygenase family protein n=1 Tax=Aquidulcibacter sp. TaxID=2052990 RepID=UPI0025BF0648
MQIKALSGVGAEVQGIDLRHLSDSQATLLKHAFADHGVLFFRDQTLTPDEHIAFARRFGPININRFFKATPTHPEIAEVRKEKDQTTNIGGAWHTDHSYDQVPALGSVLVARDLPQKGGDTLFASMYAAYDGLSDGLKETLSRLNAVHSSRHVFGAQGAYRHEGGQRIGNAEAATQDAVHPVVITHPLSGRKALYVNPAFTLHFQGWTQEESWPLLSYLYQHATNDEIGR